MESPKRELVWCRCGVPRGASEDAPLQVPASAALFVLEILRGMVGDDPSAIPLLELHEPPRICRYCGVVYMLPRQVEPSTEHMREKCGLH